MVLQIDGVYQEIPDVAKYALNNITIRADESGESNPVVIHGECYGSLTALVVQANPFVSFRHGSGVRVRRASSFSPPPIQPPPSSKDHKIFSLNRSHLSVPISSSLRSTCSQCCFGIVYMVRWKTWLSPIHTSGGKCRHRRREHLHTVKSLPTLQTPTSLNDYVSY